MKMLFGILLLFASVTSHAALLSCESDDEGEANGKAFVGKIWASDDCSSGYEIKVGKARKTCALISRSTPIYEGEVRGCGYFNGSAFVVTELLPLGAE